MVSLRERKPTALPPRAEERNPLHDFSVEIRRRIRFFASNVVCQWASLLTVTYPQTWPMDGETVKEHLRMLLQAIGRRWKGAKYLWIREFQGRGAPHFHIILTVPLPAVDRWVLGKKSKMRRIDFLPGRLMSG